MTSKMEVTIFWPKNEKWKFAAVCANGEIDFFQDRPSLKLLNELAPGEVLTVANCLQTIVERPKDEKNEH